ncbi:UNVERIFIED_CONTAM: hypothetical protein PYX00_001589 [Menopon gallinae]|uniref:FH2 domain-containing protein n=1 Tax=Menopon gallinae TaxID=328185 RepID=A0AAW2IDW6_9NEOP
MSWKYSMPYTTRDLSSSRDGGSQSKFGTSPVTSSYGSERQSRWSASSANAEPVRAYRMNTPQTDQSPIRAKTSVSDNPPSVVQRLKERYTSSNSLVNDSEKLTSTTRRPYGRSLTTLSVGNTTFKPKQSSFEAESRRDYGCGRNGFDAKSSVRKSPERDKAVSYENRFKRSDSNQSSGYENKVYSPKSPDAYTSRFLPSKNSSNDKQRKENEVNHQDEETDGEVVTVVARGTSPSQTTTSIYLRTKRADFGIEKKIHRPKIKPPFSHKETQTDKPEESHISRFGYSDINSRAKPWGSYMGGSSYNSRFSSRSSYKEKDSPTTPTRGDFPGTNNRSLSRESSTLEPKSPDSTPRSPVSVESPQSPKSITDSFKQNEHHVIAKPPTSFRSTETIKLNVQKPGLSNKEGDKAMPLRKTPSLNKPLKIETTSASDDQANSPTPNCINLKKISPIKSEPPKPIGNQVTKVMTNGNITDSSSMSESSSEDETSSSDEEVERIKASETSFVKKSITNFLQNIPNNIPSVGMRKQPSTADLINRSRSGVFHKLNQVAPPPKITFNRVESGERAWWLDNNDPVPDGVVKILSNCCLNKPEQPKDIQGNEKPGESPGNPNVVGRNLSNLNSFATDSNTNRRLTTYLINRQFTTDLDWLKDTEEDEDNPNEGKWDLDGNNNISHGPKVAIFEETEEKTNCDYSRVNLSPVGNVPNGSECVNNDNVCNTWLREKSNVAQNACANIDICLQNSVNEVTHLQLQRDDSDAKFNQAAENNVDPENQKYLQPEMKDRPQNMVHQNNLSSPIIEEKEMGDMSNLISKAKAGLVKSKTKLDVRKSSSREMSPKHEIDLYWKELVDSINRPLKLCDLDFTDLHTDDETDVFGNHREEGEIPPPPPMLILPPTNKMDLKVPAPPMSINSIPNRPSKVPIPPPIIQQVKNKKTVKLFWKEVKDEPMLPAKPPGISLIWDELVKVNVDTQKLEQLFESRAKDLITKKQHEQNKSKEIIVLDHKRSNAINIGMTKLPPPRAIKTAILKMDSTVINKEGIEKLLTMLPTEEEKLRIQDAQSSNPDIPLGSAEQFLLILASISELQARLKLWAFKLDFENSEKEICEPLMDLKQGIEILRSNKTFRAILSTLLSIGNFLNGCDVKGFQIDYLSKVPEVKDTVQKHSLLHHLCAFVMEKFPESTDLYSEIGAVTRASKVDFDELTGNIKKIEEECKLSWNYLKIIAKHEGHTAMKVKMSDFLADCAERIIVLGIVHKRIMSRFHKFIFWLGIPMNRISITRPNEIFKVISEFALEYRTTRERILQQIKKMNHREKSRSRGYLAGDTYDGLRNMNSKEAKDDAKLRQLLSGDSSYSENMNNNSTWRRQRKDKRNLIDVTNSNDDEIIETLIKTANQIPSHRPSMKDRRRSTKVYDRKF